MSLKDILAATKNAPILTSNTAPNIVPPAKNIAPKAKEKLQLLKLGDLQMLLNAMKFPKNINKLAPNSDYPAKTEEEAFKTTFTGAATINLNTGMVEQGIYINGSPN